MGRKIHKERSLIMFILLLALMMLFSFGIGKPKTASAEEVQKSQAQQIIDESGLLTFRKGSNESYNTFLFACFYVPATVYDENCTYGTVICPKRYIDAVNATDDYIEILTENNYSIANLTATNGGVANGNGIIFKFGIYNIPDSMRDMEMAYIFYVQDTAGNLEYLVPEYGSFNNQNVKDYTNAELQEMLNERLGMIDNFKIIVEKIEELVDSIWVYGIIAAGAVIVIWGAYVGIRIAVAKKNDEKINARGIVKSLIVGTIIIFVLAVGLPLLIKGLGAWVG